MKLKQLGSRIRQLRKKKGFTQAQLADKLHITWEMVSRYERGESSPLNRLPQLSKILETNPLELIAHAYDLRYVSDKSTNRIPYIREYGEKKPGSLYSAPDWVLEMDKKAIAIEATVLGDTEDALYFVSPSLQAKDGDALIVDNGTQYLQTDYPSEEKIVGVLLAKERRYKSAS